jgi:hypothetical protein
MPEGLKADFLKAATTDFDKSLKSLHSSLCKLAGLAIAAESAGILSREQSSQLINKSADARVLLQSACVLQGKEFPEFLKGEKPSIKTLNECTEEIAKLMSSKNRTEGESLN